MRRTLLGLATTLIVARALVPGEDPGRSLPLAGAGNQVLSMFWLITAAAWAGWRAMTGHSTWRASFCERGLLAIALCAFLSTAVAARYRYPGWLIGWEWLTLLVAFCSVRQLPRSQAENRGLLAVVLATGVSLSAEAIYQVFDPVGTVLDPTVAHIFGLELDGSDSLIRVRATATSFADPETFAAYLVLLLPALAIGCSLAIHQGGPRWRPALAGGCFGLACLALGTTHSWPAVLALLLVSAGLLWIGRHHLPGATWKGSLAGIAGVFIGVLALGWHHGLPGLFAARSEYLANSWTLLRASLGLGIGPGNFSRLYPALLSAPTAGRIDNPHNFLLEIVATGGVFALIALLYALLGFCLQVWPELTGRWFPLKDEPARAAEPADNSPGRTRWEFYLGGVAGLSLAFVLGDPPSQDWLKTGLIIGGRSLIWFCAYAILEPLPWTGPWRIVVLSGGVAGALFCLFFAAGFGNPALAQTLWIVVALALNSIPGEAGARPLPRWVGYLWPLVVLVVVCWVFFLLVFWPVSTGVRQIQEVRRIYPHWREQIEHRWQEALEKSPPQKQLQLAQLTHTLLAERILRPLRDLVGPLPASPTERQLLDRPVEPCVELAYWEAKAWAVLAPVRLRDREESQRLLKLKQEHSLASARLVNAAVRADPLGPWGHWAGYVTRLMFAEDPVASKPVREHNLQMAADNLAPLTKSDPSNPRVRYYRALALRQIDNSSWREDAQLAKTLNDQAPDSPGRLTEEQRSRLRSWLAGE